MCDIRLGAERWDYGVLDKTMVAEQTMRWIITTAIWLWAACQLALGHPLRHASAPSYQAYTQPPVINLYQNDRICLVGDSEIDRSECPGGWLNIVRQYVATYHSDYNFQFFNAGKFYLSSTVLNYPGAPYPKAPWDTYVVATQPTVIFLWIGLDDVLLNHGITTSGAFDMQAYGQDLQDIINEAKKIPSVRQIVLVTPLCAGEHWYGYNAQDAQIDNLIRVIQQTSVNNNIPVLNMRAMGISFEYAYNRGNWLQGVGTGDGIHPYTNPAVYPNDKAFFFSQTMESMIAGEFIAGCGM